MEQTIPLCVGGAILIPQKVVHSIHNIIIYSKMMTTELFVHFQKEVVVRGSQIRRIGWVFDKLESTFLDSSHGDCGRVCQSIVPVEEHSSSVFHAESAWFSPIAVSEDQHRRPWWWCYPCLGSPPTVLLLLLHLRKWRPSPCLWTIQSWLSWEMENLGVSTALIVASSLIQLSSIMTNIQSFGICLKNWHCPADTLDIWSSLWMTAWMHS